MADHLQPLLYTMTEASELLNTSRSKTYELRRSGRLRTVKLDDKTLVPHEAILELIAALEAEAAAAKDSPETIAYSEKMKMRRLATPKPATPPKAVKPKGRPRKTQLQPAEA